MDQIRLLADAWVEWQTRGLVFSAIVLLVAAPTHLRSPIWRHWSLVAGVIALILFPLFWLALPEWRVAIIPSEFLVDPFASPIRVDYPESGQSNFSLSLLALSFVTAILLALSYAGAWTSQRRRVLNAAAPDKTLQALFDQCANEIGLETEKARLVVGQSNEAPCTLGWLTPVVVVPATLDTWSPEEKRIVLIHELQHVKRRDWLWQQCCVILVVLYPLNPLCWKIKSKSRALAEESVDKLSLALNIKPMAYASALLNQLRICRQVRSSVAVHLHQRLDIADRVNSLIAEPYSWSRMNRIHSAQIGLLMLILVLPVASIQLTAAQTKLWNWERAASVQPKDIEPDVPIIPAISGPVLPERANPVVAPERPPAAPVFTMASAKSGLPVLPIPIVESSTVMSVKEIPIEPLPIHLETPSYPKLAIRRGWESTVRLAFDLNEHGEVVNPRVLSAGSYGTQQFEQAALGAIEASRYHVRDPGGQVFVKEDLIQTYVFELVDDERLSPAVNQRRNPP